MLNFRKLRQDFSSTVIKEGKQLFDQTAVLSAKILDIDESSIRLSAQVRGAFENLYECEIEIDRIESSIVDSNCDCTYTFDCQHISALLCYLEQNLDQIIVAYSKETDEDEVDEELREAIEEATTKEDKRLDEQHQKEVLCEYVRAAHELSCSPFFLQMEHIEQDKAELAVIFINPSNEEYDEKKGVQLQLALRLPFRSKPCLVPNVKAFLDAVHYREPIVIGGRRHLFTPQSFEMADREVLDILIAGARFYAKPEERYQKVASLDIEVMGSVLAKCFDLASLDTRPSNEAFLPLPCLYLGTIEEPLYYSTSRARIKFALQHLQAPGSTLLLEPSISLDEAEIMLEEALLFCSSKPGVLHKGRYYRFAKEIKRMHLKNLDELRHITIPEPLFGTFIENAMPLLLQYSEVFNTQLLDQMVTLPYVGDVKARCSISYLNGELEAKLYFIYQDVEIPAALSELEYKDLSLFVVEEGIMARNLVQERKLIEEIFADFIYDVKEKAYRVKSEKKIVEFMTEVVPSHQERVNFECPENLLEQFIYDDSSFELALKESDRVDAYNVELKVDGHLEGTSLDLLWDCVSAKRRFLELGGKEAKRKRAGLPRILVLDLEKISPVIQIFDEIGLSKLENHTDERPLWSLSSVCAKQFKELPIKFTMSKKLKELQKQILGEGDFSAQEIPQHIDANLRNYQVEGVHWLERLRRMHLGGILADDMGLGKTLQAIIAISQSKLDKPGATSLIICPTSLVYNWKEEFSKFNSNLKVLVIDGNPQARRKLLKSHPKYDAVITSYNLLQKDVSHYEEFLFDYVVLDEAHHIKNRGTRNAKSVKMIRACHRLILTGTPIENALDELWSLFDFLMPGLLSSYDRFVEKYIRSLSNTDGKTHHLDNLRSKVSPFILRRMKEDVLDDLPPVSEILYHCNLTPTQQELYASYAASAKEELSKLVKKEGFDKIHIHVLATLTRLKQICCHPAIFAKEKAEPGDCAKYDMLLDLLFSLIEGKHKTVIFSQYTKMLSIMRQDLVQRGVNFSYLDGTSKNRLEIVNNFNEDPSKSVFLVSLKAGGTGLNLVGADTVIHYDMWWNPAVENQATDRVHRMGQKKSVSSYKLITLNTIEEKILNLQNRKKDLVKKVIHSDDQAMSKLTWEEVLELLQT